MTCTRVLAAAAVLAFACGCNPLTGADEVDTDPSNPGPNVDPKDQMKDGPATPAITCAYPTLGNMGVDINQVVPREKKWQGLGPGDTTSREVSIAELYDCDGSKLINGHPVNAIMVDTSQYGWSICSQEAGGLEAKMNDWNNVQQLGIVWVTLLLDDPNEGPATSAGAENWANQYGLVDAYVLADPGFSMVVGNSVGTPMFTVIDPRTMTVTYKQEGSAGPGVHPELEALANKNKAEQ